MKPARKGKFQAIKDLAGGSAGVSLMRKPVFARRGRKEEFIKLFGE
jgi:hypothetical protein